MGARRIAAAVATCVAAALLMPVTGPLASGTPQVGKPCPQAGISVQQGKKTLVCKKRKGKLVWVVDNSGGGTGGGGNSGGGGSSLLDQPVPATGVWRVESGFPTDLPPYGWRGEPAWFNSTWEVATTTRVGRRCPSTTPLTHLIADLADIRTITPQGFMQPGTHNLPVPHMYYGTLPEQSTDANGVPLVSKRVDVRAPADLVVRGVMRGELVSASGTPYTEYLVTASICDTLWFFTAHLGAVDPSITRAMESAPRRECSRGTGSYSGEMCIYSYLSVPIAGGAIIGRSSGYSAGFDFGLTDASKPSAGRIDPGAFPPRWASSTCHIDYYPPAMQQELRAKLIGDNGCGQLVSDRAGTASGVWLALGQRANAFKEDLHIALARHWSERDTRVFSIGREASIPGLGSARYFFTAKTEGSNRDFTLVKPGDVVCYDGLRREYEVDSGSPIPAIYIRMTTGTVERLEIAGAPGPCPANPTMPASFQTFERRNTLG